MFARARTPGPRAKRRERKVIRVARVGARPTPRSQTGSALRNLLFGAGKPNFKKKVPLSKQSSPAFCLPGRAPNAANGGCCVKRASARVQRGVRKRDRRSGTSSSGREGRTSTKKYHPQNKVCPRSAASAATETPRKAGGLRSACRRASNAVLARRDWRSGTSSSGREDQNSKKSPRPKTKTARVLLPGQHPKRRERWVIRVARVGARPTRRSPTGSARGNLLFGAGRPNFQKKSPRPKTKFARVLPPGPRAKRREPRVFRVARVGARPTLRFLTESTRGNLLFGAGSPPSRNRGGSDSTVQTQNVGSAPFQIISLHGRGALYVRRPRRSLRRGYRVCPLWKTIRRRRRAGVL